MSTISRRAFLKTVGVGALSVAAMSVLAGCDVKNPTDTTPVAGAIEGKVSATYAVTNSASVKVTTSSGTALNNLYVDVTPATGESLWAKTYEDAYVKAAKKSYDLAHPGADFDTNSKTYNDLAAADKAAGKEAAEKAVDKLEGPETAKVYFTFANYADTPIFLASNSESADCAITAACNGAAVKCTISDMVVAANAQTKTVTCTVELPVNAKEFDVTITAPKATNVVKYTFVNGSWFDTSKIDPSKFSY